MSPLLQLASARPQIAVLHRIRCLVDVLADPRRQNAWRQNLGVHAGLVRAVGVDVALLHQHHLSLEKADEKHDEEDRQATYAEDHG